MFEIDRICKSKGLSLLFLKQQFTNMLRMIALVPDSTSQHLARAPDLAFYTDHFVRASQFGKQGGEMIPDNSQPLEWIGGKILCTFRKLITNPLLIPPFCPTDMFKNSRDRPAFIRIGFSEFLCA